MFDLFDCCGEGCVWCIYDVYEEMMDFYCDVLVVWLVCYFEVFG